MIVGSLAVTSKQGTDMRHRPENLEKRNEILSLLPDVMCVEMEGAAVAQVCLEYNVPLTVIRTISDTADHNARVDFGKFIVEVANAYSRAIVGEIMQLV